MAKDKRYSLNINSYLFAKDDNEAVVKAEKIKRYINTLDDNEAIVKDLHEAPRAKPLGKKII